jgi:hypothetical protein
MIASREVTSAEKVRSEPLYPWMEIALRIAQPLGECLFDRQARRCVDIRSMVTNGEAPLPTCHQRDRRSTVTVGS